MQLKTPRRLNTIAVSVALALSAPAAFALPTIAPTQLPGNGAVNYGTATASINTNTNTGTVTVASGATVIDWGVTTGATLFSGSSTPGFNIGASAAVIFNNNSAGTAQVLNVDVTGNPTQIYGALSATTGGSAIAGDAPTIFVANANGIVVGNGAVINAPTGLGLVNADLSGSAAQSLATMGVLPLSFQGATGGVSISAGADLHGIGSFLLVAGAGTVNIAGNVGTTATEPNVPLYIDGGVGGYASAASGFQQRETGTASSLSTLTTNNYDNTFVYQDAPTTVNLNLGTTQSAYNLVGGSMIGVNGDLNVSGNIANIAQSEISWAGTFTNTGILQSGTQSGVSLAPYTGYTDLTSSQGIYSNTSMAAYGGFVNASGAILNAGDYLSFTGASFDNEGTINLGGSQSNDLYIGATQGNITLGGAISLINTGTTASPNHPYLGYVDLYADSIVGQTVNINAALAGVTERVYVSATNLNVNAPVSVVSSGTGAFYFGAMGSSNASAAPVMNSMNVSSTGSISAPDVYIGTTISGHQAVTNLTVNGSIAATASGGAVNLGYYQFNGYNFSAINNLSGAGFISGDNIDFVNLIGSVNNITSGQILSNGFQLKAGPSGTANISASLVGNHPQGFNVKVAGNVVLDSGGTSATSETGNGFQVTPPANLNSRLVVQATGNMLVNAGTAEMGGGEFQVPGLVYLLANQSLTVNTTIDNAYTTNAPVGYGVWLLSPVINDLYPIFTNGNSGVNFMNTNYGYASSINGANPAVMATENLINTVPTGQNFPTPTVYFDTTGNLGGNGGVLPYFVNGKGYLQEMQTFLTMP
ncbi:MAG: filamentous hemagglutinin N-terminal domain-containing protein [Acidithiobacillus ferriphilus]|jgi:filamentous hemagglutinin family protein|nr:filamentous hemagglutinin N-terminal domain-containing protein [Acidithiobacillus ferriphilus]